MFKLILLLMPMYLHAYPVSDHYDGKKFFNPEKNEDKSLWDVMKWKMFTDAAEWPESVPNKTHPFHKMAPNDKAVVTFINHATFLIQFQDLILLTDPIFSERASPYSFAGPKRVRAPGLKLEEIPSLDVVVISHNHYDHLDLDSLVQLDKKFQPLFLVPLGDEKLLKSAGIQNVREMDWWDVHEIREHRISFVPTQHWSARGLFDKRESLWGGFFISSPNFKTYFGGDTGYAKHFTDTRLRLGAPDLALLPIGAYAPRDFMKVSHMNPEESYQAHKDLAATLSIGMHFGTFPLTDESIDEPVERLGKVSSGDFITLDQGESRVFSHPQE